MRQGRSDSGCSGMPRKRYIQSMLGKCWAAVCNAVPTFTKPWLNVSCLLRECGAFWWTVNERLYLFFFCDTIINIHISVQKQK